jgi:murein DD-endopeptidase MepM/ murein hydrolase activator NlpD
MKKMLLCFIVFFPLLILGQNTNIIAPTGAYPSEPHFQPVFLEKGECLSKAARHELKERIIKNKQQILAKNKNAFNKTTNATLFVQPIQPKAGFDDYGYHTINFLVDQNLTPNNNLQDYFCQSRTYDWTTGNHAGTDYIIWPYPWKRMQEEYMEIVAAADGIIVDKRDGFFDLNCQINGNPNWNGIALEHADGSQTFYLHFKNGGITSKGIGDTVTQGEFLGLAGSSGSSNIPHLHFEVHDSNGDLIDPFEGPCNSTNSESWWLDQEEYYVSKINRISTHDSTAFDDTCGEVENTYEEVNFENGDQMVLRLFFRDLRNNVPVDISITDPNGNLLSQFTWVSNFGQFFATAWANWVWDVNSTWPDGVYNVNVDFEGNTYNTQFGVNTSLSIGELEANQNLIFPNPASERFNIHSNTILETVELYDITGKLVKSRTFNNTKAQINVSDLKPGVYLVALRSAGKFTTEKVIVE